MARILVAEDNVLNFELVRDVLEGQGHEIEWARDGEEALAKAGGSAFALLLLDLHMPKLDWLEVLAALRRAGASPARVVVVSADAMGGVPEAVAQAGADAYLSKPLEVGALVAEVNRQLGR
ncbi:MAG: response regulator [Candidatus Dormibacterales bacterium]